MNKTLKIILTLLGLVYIISPYDTLPDFIPVLGQADDIFILGALFYYLWRGSLPRLFWRGQRGGPRVGNDQKAESGKDIPGGTKEDSKDPYAILGLEPGAKFKDIQEAYRQAAQMYHPDKVSHLGPEFKELAQKRFIEIQEAYETLKRRVG